MLLLNAHIAYLVLAIGMTIWVANTLKSHGHVFLLDAFGGNKSMAEATNGLLVVGFYLINLGYTLQALSTSHAPKSAAETVVMVSTRLGHVLLVLGLIHFLNLFIFSRIRKSARLKNMPAPIDPEGMLEVASHA